ncbi:MAG: OmpA family protein [Proteobacteria bacterium]|nr:OmpA family protein [Pseudomonadota bacterium]
MAENKSIIIKKIKKGHAGAHGGAWKVAYADFMTAMMAFFLLMWLLSMVVPEKRAGVEQYFKEFSLFDKQSALDVRQGGAMIPDQSKPPIPQRDELTGAAKEGTVAIQPVLLQQKVKAAVNINLPDVKDQIYVDVTEAGVRIQLVYDDKNPMFAKGSPELTASGRKALQLIGDQLRPLPNRIVVEGHTDSINYSGGKYTNWELSTQRASSARVALEQGGMAEDRLARVSGYAATQPLFPDEPTDARNRRISILVMNYVPPATGDGLHEALGADAPGKAKQPTIAEELNATIEQMLSAEGRGTPKDSGAKPATPVTKEGLKP